MSDDGRTRERRLTWAWVSGALVGVEALVCLVVAGLGWALSLDPAVHNDPVGYGFAVMFGFALVLGGATAIWVGSSLGAVAGVVHRRSGRLGWLGGILIGVHALAAVGALGAIVGYLIVFWPRG